MNNKVRKQIFLVTSFCMLGNLGLYADENLLANPGFERSKLVKISKGGTDGWAILLERGVEIQTGDAVAMPVSWMPDHGYGWTKGSLASYRYVTGQAGKEVHSGSHALFLSAERSVATVMMWGAKFSVVEDFKNIGAKKALPLKKPFFFSFYAKGKATVTCRLYTYPFGRENYGLYKATPTQFTISEEWERYEGTLEFTNLEQFTEPGRVADSGALFVMVVSNGKASIDDVGLFLIPPAERAGRLKAEH